MVSAEEFIGMPVVEEYEKGREPELISRETTTGAYAYRMRLLQLGALEGALGQLDVNPNVKPLIEALHHVLAGGEVEIKVAQQGNPEIVTELNRRLTEVTREVNEINKKADYWLLMTT